MSDRHEASASGVLVLFGIAVFALLLVVTNHSRSPDVEYVNFALAWMTGAVGGLIALFAGVLLLCRAWAYAGFDGYVGPSAALLGGVVMIHQDGWGAAIALGAVASAIVIRSAVNRHSG